MRVVGYFFYILFFLNAKAFISMIHKKEQKMYMKKFKNIAPLYTPKTYNQEEYVKYLNNDSIKIVVSTGPAGCGKSLFACQKAIIDFKSEIINKIIITRPVVSVDEEIGFLPGNINKKMEPWTKPIFDIFLEYYSKSELDLMVSTGKIEICPLAFMRGRTFKNAFIIADEMQNSSPNQMKMLATRLGDNTRMVITGDLYQTDLFKENGLNDFIHKLEINNPTNLIQFVKLNNQDIERSEIVKKVIEMYDNKYQDNEPVRKSFNESTRQSFNESTRQSFNESVRQSFNETIRQKYTNNDAALIPKHHMSSYHDIFYQTIAF
jgi:phosphate starvation-inducible PhoH-like protein